MAVTSQVFCDHHPDVSIEWHRQSLWDFGEGDTEKLASSYDLIVMDHPMTPALAASGRFRPFADTDVVPAVGGSADTYVWQKARWALPIDAACQVSVGRIDLLHAAGEPAPTTWVEVLSLAERTGRVVMPMTPINLFCALLTLCAESGSPAGTSPGESFLDPEPALAALELLRQLRDALPPQCAVTDPIGTLESLAHNHGAWYCPLIFGYSNYSRTGYAPRLLTFGGIPSLEASRAGEGAVLGGAGIAVSATSEAPELAAEYARWVSSEAVQRGEYMRGGGQPAAVAAWNDADADRITNGFFAATRATIDAASTRPKSPGYPKFQTEAAALLHSAFFADESPRRILSEIESRHTKHGCL